MQNLVSFLEADAGVEFGVQHIFRNNSKIREETFTLGTGLTILLPTWRGAVKWIVLWEEPILAWYGSSACSVLGYRVTCKAMNLGWGLSVAQAILKELTAGATLFWRRICVGNTSLCPSYVHPYQLPVLWVELSHIWPQEVYSWSMPSKMHGMCLK